MSIQVQFITKEVFANDSAAIIQQEPDENTQEAIDSSNDDVILNNDELANEPFAGESDTAMSW